MVSQPLPHQRSPGAGVWLGLFSIAAMTLLALFAPVISPYDPKEMSIELSNNPPAWYKGTAIMGHPDHLLGTDLYGRDILSHAIHGARSAMFLVLVAMPLVVFIGVTAGLCAGLGNKTLEDLFLHLMSIVSAVPSFMIAVIIVFILRAMPMGKIFGGLISLTLAYSLVNWTSLARLVHAAVLQVRGQEFMEASRSLGAGMGHQLFRHILPHVSHLIVVWVINNIPAVILLEALFGYIGIQILQVTDGSSFQDLSWGGLILSGRTQLNWNPYILLVPTLCILILSMSFSTLGEYLNRRLNPHVESSQVV